MNKRARLTTMAVLAVLSMAIIGGSLAWACTAPDYGTPSTPPAPPPPTSGTVAPAPGASTAPGAAASPAPSSSTSGASATTGAGATGVVAVPTPTPSASGSTSGAVPSTSSRRPARTTAPSPAPSAPRVPAGAWGSASTGASSSGSHVFGVSALHARISGATAGVTRSAHGQVVFTSSTAPRARATAKRPAHSAPAASPVRSASGDLWSGVTSTAKSYQPTAASSAGGQDSGSAPGMIAGFVVLGLGLTGLVGGFLVAEQRRRRASGASGRGGSGSTER